MKDLKLQNKGGKLQAVKFGRGVLDTPQKTLTTKAKMDNFETPVHENNQSTKLRDNLKDRMQC